MTHRTCRVAFGAILLCTALGAMAATPCIAQMYGGTPSPSPPPAVHAQHSESSKPHLSKSVGPQIVDAQKDLENKDFQGAMAKIKEAQAASDRQPYDDYIINRLLAAAGIGLNDMATAATAEEAAADSPAIPDDDKKAVYHDALQLSAVEKQWPKTIQYGHALAAMNGLDWQTAANLAIAYYNSNDVAHAQQYAQDSINLSKAAGQAPDQNMLQIVLATQAKQKNETGAEATLEQIALQNPTPQIWGQLVGATFGAPGTNNSQAMYLFRLLELAGGMTSEDYKDAANNAAVLGYPTEAMHLLEQGISSGKISSGAVGSELAKARRDAATDERSLSQIAAAAAKSRTGEQDVKLGEDYWGYGRFADAEAAGQRAVSKGGLRTPWEGPLLIGAAEIMQSKYADGMQTLSQVSGNVAAQKTAHLWTLYAQSKGGGAQAQAPAPAQAPAQH